MSENTPTGYRDSPDTTDGTDAGEKDTRLTTDDGAQREDSETRPGNSSD